MNRRRFLNLIGSTIIGTAIALGVPDIIIPKIIIEKTKITFQALAEAYQSCGFGKEEPDMIRVSLEAYRDVASMFIDNGHILYMREKSDIIYGNRNGIVFFNSTIESDNSLEYNQIYVSGFKYRNCGRFYF